MWGNSAARREKRSWRVMSAMPTAIPHKHPAYLRFSAPRRAYVMSGKRPAMRLSPRTASVELRHRCIEQQKGPGIMPGPLGFLAGSERYRTL